MNSLRTTVIPVAGLGTGRGQSDRGWSESPSPADWLTINYFVPPTSGVYGRWLKD